MNKNESNCICHNGYDSTCPVHRKTEKSASYMNCKYCGSPLGFCPQGEYCTNERCSYIDGHYRGPIEPQSRLSDPQRFYTQSDLDAATKPLKAEIANIKKELSMVTALGVDASIDEHINYFRDVFNQAIEWRDEIARLRDGVQLAINHFRGRPGHVLLLKKLESLLTNPETERELKRP